MPTLPVGALPPPQWNPPTRSEMVTVRGPASRGRRSGPGIGPRTRPRLRALALSSFAVLSVGVGACTTEPVQEGEAEESTDDALDLAEEPAASAILPADRGEPPENLRTEDLVEGTGAAVRSGDVLVVEYLGWRWSDGGEFASSWGAGEPLRFELGAQEMIPGWEQGILGDDGTGPLRVGSRRVLVIPPALAYDDRGAGAAVGPDETLVFVIDLVAVDPDAADRTDPEAADQDDPREGEQLDG